MSKNAFNRPPSWHSATPSFSKFREHLSITPPDPALPVEKSQFSPESNPPSIASPSYFRSLKHAATKRSARSTAPSDPESGGTHSPRSIRDRVTQFFFDVRTMRQSNDDDRASLDLPMQHPWGSTIPLTPPAWPPLHVEKRGLPAPCTCPNHAKRSRTTTALLVVLIILLLYLLADSVFLTASVLDLRRSTRPSPTPTSTAATNTNSSLTPDAQACLSQYMLNAPSSPTTYPCDTCLPLLQAASPSALASSGTNAQYAQQTAADAIQFCALRAVFSSAAPAGQTALGNAGWVRDVRFCAWGGVTCDGSGNVSTLKLTVPAIPAVVPAEIGALTGLTSLSITGDGSSPGGALPAELSTLPSLTSLNLQSTGLTTVPDIPSTLTSLELIKNAAMSPSLPSSLFAAPLNTLVINSQTLTNPLPAIAASGALQGSLRLLDLTQTGISGAVPAALAGMHALTEVHLDGNSLTGTLPAFAKGVVVTATGNSGLQGA